jgi:hypothetical protein
VNVKLPVLATFFLLTSGCALNGPVKSPAEENVNAPIQSAASSGGAPAAMQQVQAVSPAGRTRAEVHAEALEAAKHHKSTLQEDLEFFQH